MGQTIKVEVSVMICSTQTSLCFEVVRVDVAEKVTY